MLLCPLDLVGGGGRKINSRVVSYVSSLKHFLITHFNCTLENYWSVTDGKKNASLKNHCSRVRYGDGSQGFLRSQVFI